MPAASDLALFLIATPDLAGLALWRFDPQSVVELSQ
jgi:hypothetical protein